MSNVTIEFDTENEQSMRSAISVIELIIGGGGAEQNDEPDAAKTFGGATTNVQSSIPAPPQTNVPLPPGTGATPPPPPSSQTQNVAQQSATPPPPPETTNDVETDAQGLPWDERIHAGTKTMKKDGTWKRKKGVDDVTYQTVVNQLRSSTGESESAAATTTSNTEKLDVTSDDLSEEILSRVQLGELTFDQVQPTLVKYGAKNLAHLGELSQDSLDAIWSELIDE